MAVGQKEVAVCSQADQRSVGMLYRPIPSHFESWPALILILTLQVYWYGTPARYLRGVSWFTHNVRSTLWLLHFGHMARCQLGYLQGRLTNGNIQSVWTSGSAYRHFINPHLSLGKYLMADAMYMPTCTKYCEKPMYTSRLLLMVPPIECDLSSK